MKKRALFVLAIMAVLALSAGLVLAASGSITTMFASNNGYAGNMFDVTAAVDIEITSFDINVTGTTGEVWVYYKQGTYVGSETTPGDWILLGSAMVTSNGDDVPTPLAVGGLTIPAGETYGLYITVEYGPLGMEYTNGTNTYSNSEVTLDLGAGTPDIPFDGFFDSRTWNGTIYYDIVEEAPEEEQPTAEPVYQRWDPGDARINPHPAMEVAIYCVDIGIDLYGLSDYYGVVTTEAFDAAAPSDTVPFFTSDNGVVRVYHLANGWWGVQKDQVRGDSTETYQFAFDGCMPTVTVTTVYDAAGNLLVYETTP